jgi:hypothetical protein
VNALKRLLNNRSEAPVVQQISRASFIDLATIDPDGHVAIIPSGNAEEDERRRDAARLILDFDSLPDAMMLLRCTEYMTAYHDSLNRERSKVPVKKKPGRKRKKESVDYNDA